MIRRRNNNDQKAKKLEAGIEKYGKLYKKISMICDKMDGLRYNSQEDPEDLVGRFLLYMFNLVIDEEDKPRIVERAKEVMKGFPSSEMLYKKLISKQKEDSVRIMFYYILYDL